MNNFTYFERLFTPWRSALALKMFFEFSCERKKPYQWLSPSVIVKNLISLRTSENIGRGKFTIN